MSDVMWSVEFYSDAPMRVVAMFSIASDAHAWAHRTRGGSEARITRVYIDNHWCALPEARVMRGDGRSHGHAKSLDTILRYVDDAEDKLHRLRVDVDTIQKEMDEEMEK